MKVFVATPLRDTVTAEFAQSLFYAGLDCYTKDIEVIPRIVRHSCFIEMARSALVKYFLETDCTHLFFIDSDIGFEAHALGGLVQAGVPFAAGVYRQREPKVNFNGQIYEPQEFRGPWVRFNRVATGFMCLERHVLEEMVSRVHTCKMSSMGEVPMVFRTDTSLKDGKPRQFVGEDYCFCDDYTELYEKGVFDQPIWVYPDITFDHDGYIGNLHESLSVERTESRFIPRYAMEGTDEGIHT
jgi:hypothetical protein